MTVCVPAGPLAYFSPVPSPPCARALVPKPALCQSPQGSRLTQNPAFPSTQPPGARGSPPAAQGGWDVALLRLSSEPGPPLQKLTSRGRPPRAGREGESQGLARRSPSRSSPLAPAHPFILPSVPVSPPVGHLLLEPRVRGAGAWVAGCGLSGAGEAGGGQEACLRVLGPLFSLFLIHPRWHGPQIQA